MTLEKRYKATITANQITSGAEGFSKEMRLHARRMVEDGYGHFKFTKRYGPEGGSYEGATLWVCDDTTRTIKRIEIQGWLDEKEQPK